MWYHVDALYFQIKLQYRYFGITRWLTGHCYLAQHQAIINNQIDPTCFLCQEAEETTWHLLPEYPVTLDLRLKELPPEP
jgi:hypothetical protein